MNKFYMIGLIFMAFFLCFAVGNIRGNAKCKEKIAEETMENIKDTQIIYQNKRKEADEKVFSTGVSDIRCILRQKYTIAD